MVERIVPAPYKPRSPYEGTPFGPHIIAAVKSLFVGNATSEQQIAAIEWIVRDLCGRDELGYFPSTSDKDFALGKRCVGMQILGLRDYRSKDGAA